LKIISLLGGDWKKHNILEKMSKCNNYTVVRRDTLVFEMDS